MECVKGAVKIKEPAFLFLNILSEKGTQPAIDFACKDIKKISDAHLESLSKRANLTV